MSVTEFQKTVWKYYKKHKRSMSWRSDTRPYYVFVSEIMLQQTHVARVKRIFPRFIRLFPSWRALARASRAEVLSAWQGLGYNRRALYLHHSAHTIVRTYRGRVPRDSVVLKTLKGIGINTAGSIRAFAFNQPAVFIETNIRTVFLFHFFHNRTRVSDAEILPLIHKTLPAKNFREWYWALMDYGSYLKERYGNQNIRSAHYAKQASFKGSHRQLRGRILRTLLTEKNGMTPAQLARSVCISIARLRKPLNQLHAEGFIATQGKKWRVK